MPDPLQNISPAPASRRFSHPPTQKFTIIAQDPALRDQRGKIVRAEVAIPAELLQPGPWGYRVQVIDYDAASDQLWTAHHYERDPKNENLLRDPFTKVSDQRLLSDPKFHQQNVYVIVMRILARFEHALGRRVSWSFGGHQLKVAPHATCDANAFYSKEDEALFFGYFVDPGFRGKQPVAGQGLIFSCLSHDIVAHETTHALVDGLRERYTEPSSPDQAAFHEGFSDVVALFSVFALPEVMRGVLGKFRGDGVVSAQDMKPDYLKKTVLFGLAEEMGTALSQTRGGALRRSVELVQQPKLIRSEEFQEPHRRGEILVAAMLNALVEIWSERLDGLRRQAGQMNLARVVEEGQRVADLLLTMAIRALDYCPPVHLEFSDYLSALLTGDREIRPDDSVYDFRQHLRASFRAFGIKPTSTHRHSEPGLWCSPEEEIESKNLGELSYDRAHFEPMQRDPDEVFRFIWENRDRLGLTENAYSQVQSVRPCVRVGDDGFTLRETVAEYVQILRLMPNELEAAGYTRPPLALLPEDREVFLHGGGTLVFNEWGRLKYHVHNHLSNFAKQSERLRHLAQTGYYLQRRPVTETIRAGGSGAFARMHLNRGLNRPRAVTEGWVGAPPAPPVSSAHAHNHGPSAAHLEEHNHADA